MSTDVKSSPSKRFLEEALFVVDASSFIFRAYYGLQAELTAPDGTPTHATFAFVNMIKNLITTFDAKNLVLVWDGKEPSFRAKIYKDYKANRSAPPEDLSLQIENSRKLMDLWGVAQVSAPGFEADDVIATIVNREKGPVVIVTSDKDLLQLVGEHVWCLDTKKNQWSNVKEAEEKFGVSPMQIADVQALMGDSSDNIPGAPGIGPKGAAELIRHFGSLTEVVAAAKERSKDLEKKYPDPLSGKKLSAIAQNLDLVETSRKLVSLEKAVSCPMPDFRRGEAKSDLLAELKRLGFRRLAEEVEGKAASAEAVTLVSEGFPKSRCSFHCVASLDEWKHILKRAESHRDVAFDTETFSLENLRPENLVGLSLCFDSQEAYYVPLRHKEGKNLSVLGVLDPLQKLFSEKRIIFHNAKFDWHQLSSEGRPFCGAFEDTILAAFLLDPSSSHNLEDLAERLLGEKALRYDDVVKKGENFSDLSLEVATRYAAEDTYLTLELWRLFEPQLKSKELWKLYESVDRPIVRVLFELERVGVKLDSHYLNVLYRELEQERFQCEDSARELLKNDRVPDFETINFASTKQLARVLFEDLKLPVIKEKKTGPSTDVEVLEELKVRHPFPKILLELRELSKLLSTYIQPLPMLVNENTKRLHTHFSQIIAQTGRLASSEPNLQNIPIRTERGNRIRKAFVADKGYSLYSADYSQIELRFLAEFTGDPALLEAFQQKADIHRRTAALIMGKAESNVTDDERRAAKAVNFGIIYGQTPFGLAKSLGISRAQAAQFIESYFNSYKSLKAWMERTVEEARAEGYVKTLCGRRRPVPDINSKNPALRNFSERMAINSPLQGTSADLIKIAMVRVSDWIQKEKAPVRMVLQIHDELLFEVQKGFEKDFERSLRPILDDPDVFRDFTGKSLRVPLLSDHAYGEHWGEL